MATLDFEDPYASKSQVPQGMPISGLDFEDPFIKGRQQLARPLPEAPSYGEALKYYGKAGLRSALRTWEIPARMIYPEKEYGKIHPMSEYFKSTEEEERRAQQFTIPQQIVGGAAGLPGAALKYMPMMAAGPIAGPLIAAGAGATEEYQEGRPERMLRRGLEEGLTMGVFSALGRPALTAAEVAARKIPLAPVEKLLGKQIGRAGRAAIGAGTFALPPFIETGEPRQAIAPAVTGGLLFGLTGKTRYPALRPEAVVAGEPQYRLAPEVNIPKTTEEAHARGQNLTKEEAIETWEEYKRNIAKPVPEGQEGINIGFENQMLRETVEGYLGATGKLSLTPREIDQGLHRAGQYRLAPTWYSTLQRILSEKMPESMPVGQLATVLGIGTKEPAKWAGIKADEIKWTGLDEWLKTKMGRVSKTEVMEFLKQNEVRVEEVLHRTAAEGTITGEERAGLIPPKFSQWQLPGGENCRELLLTLPQKEFIRLREVQTRLDEISAKPAQWHKEHPEILKEWDALMIEGNKLIAERPPTFKGTHFDEPNVLAHVRFNDRVDAQGKKVLFIEEVQSDWHQAGREKGYIGEMSDANLKRYNELAGKQMEWRHGRGNELTSQESQELSTLYKEYDQTNKVPPAPFSKTWHELMMRRMVRWASENGYDKVAWTTGEQQAARYDLSKQIDSLGFVKHPTTPKDNLVDIWALKNGQRIIEERVQINDLDKYVGKDLARKIVEDQKDAGGFEGLDLQVGGEGMKGFYDKILPEYMNKFGKKWGAKVGETQLDITERDISKSTRDEFGNLVPTQGLPFATRTESVHSLDITPSMKESALREGFPMFRAGEEKPIAGAPLPMDILRSIIDKRTSELKNAPSIMIAETSEEFPSHLATKGAAGAYDRDSRTIWIARDRMISEAEVLNTINHEAIGHYALNSLMDPSFDPFLNRVFMKYGRTALEKEMSDLGYRFNFDTREGKLSATREKLAMLTETGENPGLLKQMYAWIREQLAKVFPGMEITDAEIQRVIAQAKGKMETGVFGVREERMVGLPEYRLAKLSPEEQRIQDHITSKTDEKISFRERVKDIYNNLYENYVNPWYQIEKTNPQSVTFLRLSHPKGYGLATESLKVGVPDFNQIQGWVTGQIPTTESIRIVSKGYAPIFESISKEDRPKFSRYEISKRTIEQESKGLKTGIDLNDANTIVNTYKNQSIGNTTYEQLFNDVRDFRREVLRYYQKSGMLSEEGFNLLDTENAMYVPFFRVHEQIGPQGIGTGITAKKVLKRWIGKEARPEKLIDPRESDIKNTYMLFGSAEQNMALKYFADSAPNLVEKLTPGMPGFKTHQYNVSLYEMRKSPLLQSLLEEAGMGRFDNQGRFRLNSGVKSELVDEVIKIFRPNFIKGRTDMFYTYENGKPILNKIDPEIGKALQTLDRSSVGIATRILSFPAKTLRAGAILSPEFWMRNPPRDWFSAFVYSKYGFTPWDFFKGLVSAVKGDEAYQKLLMSGGSQSAFISLDRTDIRLTAKQLLAKKKLSGAISGDSYTEVMKNLVTHPIEALRILTELSEMGTRLGVGIKAIEKGAPLPEAAMQFRESTLDFGKIASGSKAVNMIIAFWNANVRGIDKLIGSLNFKKNPELALRTFTKATISITIPSLLLAYYNQGDPRYQELPEWQKALFWIIPTEKHLWRIPKPFELGIIFGSVPEYIMRYLRTGDPETFENIGKALTAGSMPGIIPTAALPFVENWANKSFFTGRPIVPRGKEALRPEYQYQPYTTETAKWIGRQLSYLPIVGEGAASPAKIENFIRGWSGGLGGHALRILDKGLVSAGIVPEEIKPSRTLADIPVIRAFVSRYPGSDASSIQRFYETYHEVHALKSSINALRKQGKIDEARTLLGENRAILNFELAINRTQKALANMRGVIDRVYANPDMNPDEKRNLIEQMYLRMIEITRNINQRIGRNPWSGLESSLPFLNLKGALGIWENATDEEKLRIAPIILDKFQATRGIVGTPAGGMPPMTPEQFPTMGE